MKMKKGTIILIAIIAVIVLLVMSVIGSYNGLVDKQQAVEKATGNISTDLQARADKIPNLVSVVKDYADYEESTLTAVIEARNAVKNAETPNELVAASDRLDLSINALVEAYPELKANTQYTALIDEISGSENRINISRKDFNSAVENYNSSIRKFPTSIIASLFGFEKYDYFENSAGSENAPNVGDLLK